MFLRYSRFANGAGHEFKVPGHIGWDFENWASLLLNVFLLVFPVLGTMQPKMGEFRQVCLS
jgi:hypothetical protein